MYYCRSKISVLDDSKQTEIKYLKTFNEKKPTQNTPNKVVISVQTLTATLVSPELSLIMFLAIPSKTSPKAPLPKNFVNIN